MCVCILEYVMKWGICLNFHLPYLVLEICPYSFVQFIRFVKWNIGNLSGTVPAQPAAMLSYYVLFNIIYCAILLFYPKLNLNA